MEKTYKTTHNNTTHHNNPRLQAMSDNTSRCTTDANCFLTSMHKSTWLVLSGQQAPLRNQTGYKASESKAREINVMYI